MRTLCLIASFVLSLTVCGQLKTNGGIAPALLVQNVLVGEGVEVSNVKYQGSAGAIGQFSGSTSMDIEEGLILTTGTINSGADGPYGPNDKPNAGMDNKAGGYNPLSALVGGTDTYNAAVLEFDFVPQSDTVKFEYVFGSEEYPEWVGDQFNDVFAFFISGPGIDGNKNMAIVPGTNQAVAINNINNGKNNLGPCKNCEYYVNNGSGNNAPYNADPFYIQYDGFTTPLQATSPVECGKKYHLIIAITDVGDPIYDSGIFLAANSLRSEQPVNARASLSRYFFEDNHTLAQGCTSATVRVRRTGQDLDKPVTIPLKKSGTAVQGEDYSPIPNQLNFAAGEVEKSFSLDALENLSQAGEVNLIIEYTFTDACGIEVTDQLELFFKPVEELIVKMDEFDVFCKNDTVTIGTEVTGGLGNYTYNWSTGENTSEITVSPNTTTTYELEVTDECLSQAEVSTTVKVPENDSVTVEITAPIYEDCPFVPYDLEALASGGTEVYTYQWLDEWGNEFENQAKITVKAQTTTTYTVVVHDECGEEARASTVIHILSPPLNVSVYENKKVCPYEPTHLKASAEGGLGEHYFYWSHNGDTNRNVTVYPSETSYYKVIVQDDCKTFSVSDSIKITVEKPDANFAVITSPIFHDLPITFQNLSNSASFYEWWFGDGGTSDHVHPNHTFSSAGEYEITLIAEDERGCFDTINKILEVKHEVYLYVPNAFIPSINGRTNNEVFKVSAINITDFSIAIYNRWGETVFTSNDVNFEWDGTMNGNKVGDGTYVWKICYKSINDDEEEIQGHVTLLK